MNRRVDPSAALWPRMVEGVAALRAALGAEAEPPIVLSSVPELPQRDGARVPAFSFIHGPAGRNIALAIGLRAARPLAPLVLVMNADSVSLGTNHLIHAARRNIGMTLVLLRSELTRGAAEGTLDRAQWRMPAYQEALEAAPRPLEWAIALEAALVARANLLEPGALEALLVRAARTPGMCVIGVTADASLPTGVLGQCDWPEYFASYRAWAAPLRLPAIGDRPQLPLGETRAPTMASVPHIKRRVPRYEVRIAGFGGQGVKLAGSVLSEAAGYHEGLWATQRGDYGSATRGGPSSVDVVIGSDPITYPGADHADTLVVLTQAAADRYARSTKPGARLVADSSEVRRVPDGALEVPITALAREHTGKPIAAGVVALGCVAALGDVVSPEALHRTLAAHVPPATLERNIAACSAGFAAARAALERRT